MGKMCTSSYKNKMKICRLCLSMSFSHFSLLEEENKANAAMLKALTNITIPANDEISTSMCLKCKMNLQLAFRIQQRILKNQNNFDEIVKKLQGKQTQVDGKTGRDSDSNDSTELETHTAPKRHLPSDTSTTMCHICGVEKSTRRKLTNHMYFVHSPKQPCTICGKLITKSNLRRHLQDHDPQYKVCEICGAVLKNQSIRSHLLLSHKNSGGYPCPHCGQAYRKKQARDLHVKKRHDGNADFVCDTCGKRFFTAQSLKVHVEGRHEKLRPFVCDFCNVGFSSKFSLRTHRRQHTNETPYRCEVCGEGFRQNVSLKAHKRSKHNIVEALTEECKVCGKRFASKTAVESHQRVH